MEDFNGDQTVLNHVLAQDWLPLDKIYNLQVGHDLVAFNSGWNGHFGLAQEPLIITIRPFASLGTRKLAIATASFGGTFRPWSLGDFSPSSGRV